MVMILCSLHYKQQHRPCFLNSVTTKEISFQVIYWAPDEKTKEVLANLKPNNDLCESLFSLNNWLTTQMPNASQATKSNIVEFSYNHTVKWLDQQPDEVQKEIIGAAVANRRTIRQQKQLRTEQYKKARREKVEVALEKAAQKQMNASAEISELENEHLIHTLAELNDKIAGIKALSISIK